MRIRCTVQTRRLASLIGLFVLVYLSMSQEEPNLVTSQAVKDVLESCKTLQQQIEQSEFPFPENQYSHTYLFQPPQVDMLRVNRDHKISICVPYKAGSETWRYLMDSLSNHTVPQSKLENIDQIQDYLKAVQVRDPYERLLSAYRFIFSRENGLRNDQKLNKHLLEYYDHLKHDTDMDGKPVASFAQFIQSIVTGYEDLPSELHHLLTEGAALHWLPYYVQCNPCHPSYTPNTIININTWHQDTNTFLNNANIDTNR